MFSRLKQKYADRTTLTLILVSVAGSILYGLIRRPFLRYFIDGVTLTCALCLLAGGVLYRSLGAGYSFMLVRRQTGKKVSELMKERYEAEAGKSNPPLYAGLFLLILMLLLLLIYYL